MDGYPSPPRNSNPCVGVLKLLHGDCAGVLEYFVWRTATNLNHEKFKVATSALPTAQPARGEGRGMPAGKEGVTPARARPRARIDDVGQSEEGCRLAMREQPQPVHGRGQQGAISGLGKRDAGWPRGRSPSACTAAGRNWVSQREGRRMRVCEQRTAPAGARPRAAICEVGKSEKGCRLALREQPQRERDRACIEAGTWPVRDWNWDK